MKKISSSLVRTGTLAAALLLAGCSVAPIAVPAPQVVPTAFKEAIAADPASPWKLAEPSDALARGEWWQVFGDARLNELEREAAAANASLQVGWARLAQARALARGSQAEQLPRIDVGAGPNRFRTAPVAQGLDATADTATQTRWRVQASASYEVDLFGRVASAVGAAQADAEQAHALYRSLLLALQADVAQHYFTLRALDSELALLDETVQLRQAAAQLLERHVNAGETSELDLARARTELSVTRAEAAALARRRALLEHALAVLLGRAPADLTLVRSPLDGEAVAIPAGLPSALLERRPDIAAAERAMAAANARIGVARAAAFPRLSLTGALGVESGELGDLLRWSSRSWALGPLAGGLLSLPLFDGGRHRALSAQAQAQYDEAAAAYRQQVLVALREVEDQLSSLRWLAQQSREQQLAVDAARRARQLSDARYRSGLVNQLELIDAERSLLATQRAATQVNGERALATVGLIRALGGGWDPSPLSASAEPDPRAALAAAPARASQGKGD